MPEFNEKLLNEIKKFILSGNFCKASAIICILYVYMLYPKYAVKSLLSGTFVFKVIVKSASKELFLRFMSVCIVRT